MIQVHVNAKGLLNYVHTGRLAKRDVQTSIRKALNVGRTAARREISAQFRVRTGRLRAAARKMQTKVTVKPFEIKGRIAPLPRLLNIFEHGATLSKGRGFLRARPVVKPASEQMEVSAHKELNEVMASVGR